MSAPWFASLRWWLASRRVGLAALALPRGYAIWTWGASGDEGDTLIISKERAASANTQEPGE